MNKSNLARKNKNHGGRRSEILRAVKKRPKFAPPLLAPKGSVDFVFMTTVFLLLAIGLVMVFSASSPTAFSSKATNFDGFYYLKRQIVWAFFGVFAMFFMANFDYRKLARLGLHALFASVILLLAVLIIGTEVNGAKRWLGLTRTFGFQPSELAKVAVILFFAHNLSRNREKIKNFWTGLFPHLAIIGVFALLLLLEPHLSCTLLIAVTGSIMLFVAGARVTHFLMLGAPVLIGLAGIIIGSPYRRDRMFAFLNPFSDPLGKGYQIIQSLYAIGSGKLFGLGLGQSRQKYLYLPEPQNDFIFSIICEELGLFGAAIVIFLFALLLWRGLRIASSAPDMFGCLLCTGFTTLIAVQALTNIAVVTSSIPATGMPLPFFSYGGTALVFSLASMGVILSVSRAAG